MKAYKLKTAGLEPKGTIAFPLAEHDYGLAADNTRRTGRKHISLTKAQYGGGPGFTHPVEDLETIEVDHLPSIDDEHVHAVCKIGQGEECCRYLVASPGGFSCEKLSRLKWRIDIRVEEMTAKGDNCDGRRSL